MRYRSRFALGALAATAAVIVGSVAIATSGSASVVTAPVMAAAGGTSSPTQTSAPTSSPTQTGGPTTTTPPTDEPEADPCSGGAAWDAFSQGWRAWVECPGWGGAAVLPGSYGSQQEASSRGWDEAYIQSRGQKVVDGPGCDPPFVLC